MACKVNPDSMTETLTNITRLIALVFFLTSMGGIGLGLTLRQFFAPLRDARFVCAALLANFLVAPALALGIAWALHLEGPIANGLLLIGLAAGAPFMPKVVDIAKGDPSLAIALMTLTMVATLVFLPVALPALLPAAEVDALKMALFLATLLLLPFFAGVFVRARLPGLAGRLRPILERVSGVALLLVLVLVLSIHIESLRRLLGTGAIAAAVLFSVLTAASGWLLGGRDRDRRTVLCLGTGLRNIPAALLVGAQNFDEPEVPVMVLVTTLVSILLLIPLAVGFARQAPLPA